MSIVYVLLEISDNEPISVYTTIAANPISDILMNFAFRSNKSLINFLEINKDSILESIPCHETDILDTLENQNYLNYLTSKWYMITNTVDVIQPNDILDLAIKYKGVSHKNIMNYILLQSDDYLYEIHKSVLNV